MLARRHVLWLGMAVGALLTCAPVLGMFGTLFGMSQALNTLRQSGIGDPRQLATAIAGMLLATAGSFALFPVGIVLLVVCGLLLRRSRRSGPPPLPRFPENMENLPKNY